ncbi:MAG TPA: hypothetical protein VGI58_01105, partial [Streptosporangiaceae bacterium]
QVNGRTRFTITVPVDAGTAEIEAIVTADPAFAQHTADQAVHRLVIVPGRIVNVVLSGGER